MDGEQGMQQQEEQPPQLQQVQPPPDDVAQQLQWLAQATQNQAQALELIIQQQQQGTTRSSGF